MPRITQARRTSAPKNRSGCITCKRRHLKCDEAKPSCKTCAAGGRECEGYQDTWRIMTTAGASVKKRSIELTRGRLENHISDLNGQPKARLKNEEAFQFFNLPQEPVTASILTSIMSMGTISSTEKRYVDFFRLHTISQLSRGLQVDFWGSWVLRVLFSHPIVWYSALAVSAMHRSFSGAASSSSSIALLQQSNRAASATAGGRSFELPHTSTNVVRSVRLLRGESITLEMSANLAESYRALRNNVSAAINHINGGTKILQEQIENKVSDDELRSTEPGASDCHSVTVEQDALRLLFAHLNFQAGIFRGNDSDPAIDANTSQTRSFDPSEMLLAPGPFESTTHMASWLKCVKHGSLRLVRISELDLDGKDVDALLEWKRLALTGFRESNLDDQMAEELKEWIPASLNEARAVAILRVREVLKNLLLAQAVVQSEMACDDYSLDFQTIFKLASQLTQPHHTLQTTRTAMEIVQPEDAVVDLSSKSSEFCLRSELNLPLFIAAWKCRDPALRRRLIWLIKIRRVKEGLWDGEVLVIIAERIVDIEERDCRDALTCTDISAPSRVVSIGIVSRQGKQGVLVSYRQSNGKVYWHETTAS